MPRIMKQYIMWTYAIFLCFLVLIGVVMMVFKMETLADILKVVSAWTSTFVFIVMFRKIKPGVKLASYVKSQFSEKLKVSTVLWIIFLQVSIFVGVLFYRSMVDGILITEQVITSWLMLLGVFIHMLLGGPLGEELGWRSYVLTDLQQTCSPLKSAIIVGILWGFWHTPLWFLSGYGGMQLVQYIICFMVSIIATSIIMTTFYNINRNLVIPIIIHQLFNYFMTIQIGNRVDIFVSTAILYVIAAVALILINYKQSLYKRNI